MKSAVRIRIRRRVGYLTAAAVILVPAGACSTSPGGTEGADGGSESSRITVVAAENFWGSIAAQLGGTHVRVTSIIDNPDADPHDYEPTPADGRTIASARLVIVNGIGYDTWATKMISANPNDRRELLVVGDLVGARAGDNPHRWYSPTAVTRVIDRITATYQKLDPTNSAYFAQLKENFLTGSLHTYSTLIHDIRSAYSGTPVGASESIVAMLTPALGLTLVTPDSFLNAISAGGEPSVRDKATIDRQIRGGQIKIYIYNSQNATPDVQAQVNEARAAGIPVATVTETMVPAGTSFQDWQSTQLKGIKDALDRATGR